MIILVSIIFLMEYFYNSYIINKTDNENWLAASLYHHNKNIIKKWLGDKSEMILKPSRITDESTVSSSSRFLNIYHKNNNNRNIRQYNNENKKGFEDLFHHSATILNNFHIENNNQERRRLSHDSTSTNVSFSHKKIQFVKLCHVRNRHHSSGSQIVAVALQRFNHLDHCLDTAEEALNLSPKAPIWHSREPLRPTREPPHVILAIIFDYNSTRIKHLGPTYKIAMPMYYAEKYVHHSLKALFEKTTG